MKTNVYIHSSVLIIALFIGIFHTNAQIAKQPDGVSWEIFNNKTTCDFNLLRTTDSIPDQIIHLDSLYTTNNSTLMDFFASRIKGYLIPTISGEYTFCFACDNTGQFWLSPDTAIANAQLKNEIFSIQNDWSQNTSSQELIAGQKYYFEVLHYDTAYTDMVKLGWKIPGDTIPTVIKMPNMSSCGDGIPVKSFNIIENEIVAYTGYITSPGYILSPWNSTDKSILWQSSNETIASVNEEGIITTIGPGNCMIIGVVAENSALSDTIHVTVTDYYGPFFVKQNAIGNGHSWDDAIDLPLLTQRLQQGQRENIADIYISEGVYKPTTTIDRNKTFFLNNIRLVGGFSATSIGTDTTNRNITANETILSGEIGLTDYTFDNSYHVVSAIYYTQSSIYTPPFTNIDGVTICDGRASSSSYGYIPGLYYFKNDDNGGGVFNYHSDMLIQNCRIVNNSAWNSGGGLFSHENEISLENCLVNDNIIQQPMISTGGIFFLLINGHGSGVALDQSTLFAKNCKFYNNNGGAGNGKVIFLESADAIINGCSLYNNSGERDDIYATSSGLILINSSIEGDVGVRFSSPAIVKNTTIVGDFNVGYTYGRVVTFDNTIVTGFNLNDLADTTIEVQYCILGRSLFGSNKETVLSDSVPPNATWLDPLAYNGGLTPTMKLKNIPGNYALNYGNPLYLDSTDQRGAIRTNFVSIGAYQWVDATEIVISPNQLTLTQGDSIDYEVYFLPAFSSDGLYTVSCSDNNIARVDSSMIYALTPGFVNIIAQSVDGTMRDTLLCQVIANAGIEEVNLNSQFRFYPNPVAHELMIESKGNTGKVNFEVINIFGQVVFNGFFTEQAVINMSELHPGAYLIKCTTDKTVEVMKILKN